MNYQKRTQLAGLICSLSVFIGHGSLAHAQDDGEKKYLPVLHLEAGKWNIEMPILLGGRYESTSALLLDHDNFTLESKYTDVVGRIGLSIDANDGILPFLLKAEFETDLISGASGAPSDKIGFGLSGTETQTRINGENFSKKMLRKAYLRASLMQYAHVMAGVMTSHWGMGLVANDGAHGWESGNAKFNDPRGGDRVMRAMLASGPHLRRHQIFATIGYDKLLNDDAMLDGDEGSQIVAALMYGRNKSKSAGLYFVRRQQITPARTLRTLEQGYEVHLSEGITNVNVIDATFKLEFDFGESIGNLTLEGEAAYITGETTVAPSADFVTHKIQQIGMAARATLDRQNHGVILDFLLASGDGSLSDEYQSGFKADRNYSMGFLMYRHLLAGHTGRSPLTASDADITGIPVQDIERFASRGNATNTIAFFPRAYYQLMRESNDDFLDLEFYGGPLFAFSAQPLIDPFRSKLQGGAVRNALDAEPGNYFGTEIDFGFRLRKLFGSSQLTVGTELGYLLPGSAFKSETGQNQANVFGVRAIMEYRL